MSEHATFKRIPIVTESKGGGGNMARIRQFTRIGAIVALILIPLLGLFRIDVSSGFVILDRQIWFADFFIVFGFWLAAACLFIVLYSTMGNVFCGWVCPQNTFSSWANNLTSRLLGKRAIINWGDEPASTRVSSGKNHWRNWTTLVVKILGAAMLISIIPMLYFLPREAIWAFVTLQAHPALSNSLYWIYSVFVFIVATNIALIRHYVCRYMCIYRMWQFLFKTRDTLHIEYDASRGQECATCNYCETKCPVNIDPRNTLTYDSCINCGECVSACDSLHKKQGVVGLLSLKFGPPKGKQRANNKMDLTTLLNRTKWVAPVFALGVGLLAWGIIDYNPYHLSVYRAEILHGKQIQDYRINIANKTYGPATVAVQVEGIPAEMYSLNQTQADFTTADRKDINLHIKPGLATGIYSITVHAQAADGWKDSFQIQHYVERG